MLQLLVFKPAGMIQDPWVHLELRSPSLVLCVHSTSLFIKEEDYEDQMFRSAMVLCLALYVSVIYEALLLIMAIVRFKSTF